MKLSDYAKVFAVGVVGAAIGLGAASLNAQSRPAGSGTALVFDEGNQRVWHAEGDRIRFCDRGNVYGSSPDCGNWQ